MTEQLQTTAATMLKVTHWAEMAIEIIRDQKLDLNGFNVVVVDNTIVVSYPDGFDVSVPMTFSYKEVKIDISENTTPKEVYEFLKARVDEAIFYYEQLRDKTRKNRG